MAKFTDKEIREAFRDAKMDREIARGLGLQESERAAYVVMTALMRWINDRKKSVNPKVSP